MARAFVVADDVTGANTSAARMAMGGLSARTVVELGEIEPALRTADVVAVSTSSRGLPAVEAAARVRAVMQAGAGVRFVAKRVDSTLRGNVGAELDAILDALGATSRALVVPAFPTAGRTTVDGVQHVDGQRLGRVADVLAAQSRRRIAFD
ncbi:MAG: four-carbon acid sugar kinase family protein, partial [Egibacteraceae bacterium]